MLAAALKTGYYRAKSNWLHWQHVAALDGAMLARSRFKRVILHVRVRFGGKTLVRWKIVWKRVKIL